MLGHSSSSKALTSMSSDQLNGPHSCFCQEQTYTFCMLSLDSPLLFAVSCCASNCMGSIHTCVRPPVSPSKEMGRTTHPMLLSGAFNNKVDASPIATQSPRPSALTSSFALPSNSIHIWNLHLD